MNSRIFSSALLAVSFALTPALAVAKPKNIFEALFPKLIEKRLEREAALNPKPAPAVKVRVSSPKTYTYRIDKPVKITLKPDAPVGDESQPLSRFQADLAISGDLKLAGESNLAAAVSRYYQENPAYRWINNAGESNARARSIRKLFDGAGEYGLRSQDYVFAAYAPDGDADDAAKALVRLENEVSITLAALRYAMDARYGTINPNRLSGYHDFPETADNADPVLAELLGSGLPANTLSRFHPANTKFQALKSELAILQGARVVTVNLDLETKILIKPGLEHPRLPDVVDAIEKRASSKLLEAHGETLNAYQGGTVYSPGLVKLVTAYQKATGLGADGIVGRRTIAKLVGAGPAGKTGKIILAMERLRWLPHDLGQRHVFINQPAYRAMYIADGKQKLSMRAIVGKPANQTNFFYDEVERVVFNPYWGVPRSIFVNTMLPKLQENPSYLDAGGYQLTNSGGKRVASASVDWSQIGANSGYYVRQPPGAKNALGRLKILFPNKHAIYMHDTPSRNLFNSARRAFSYGCVRLQQPLEMAAAVLGKDKKYISSQISTGRNISENLSVKIPVYVSYFTAWPGADGSIGYYPDIYSRDRNLEKARTTTARYRTANAPAS